MSVLYVAATTIPCRLCTLYVTVLSVLATEWHFQTYQCKIKLPLAKNKNMNGQKCVHVSVCVFPHLVLRFTSSSPLAWLLFLLLWHHSMNLSLGLPFFFFLPQSLGKIDKPAHTAWWSRPKKCLTGNFEGGSWLTAVYLPSRNTPNQQGIKSTWLGMWSDHISIRSA